MRREFKDQMGRSISISFPPRRIISLVPSQTELLHDLGLEDQVVGITKFCVHPESWFKNKTRIGGTKKLHLEKIEALNPDLIIGNKEENEEGQINQLMEKHPVWMSDITGLEDALQMIEAIGAITNTSNKASRLNTAIRQAFNQLPARESDQTLRVAYFIWRKPYMVAANQTFINSMLEVAGLENVFKHQERYPEIELELLQELDLDAILLSSEPYPFKAKHFEEFRKICPRVVIQLVDGELFSWYGSRLLLSAPYFRNLQRDLYRQIKVI